MNNIDMESNRKPIDGLHPELTAPTCTNGHPLAQITPLDTLESMETLMKKMTCQKCIVKMILMIDDKRRS